MANELICKEKNEGILEPRPSNSARKGSEVTDLAACES
jgi:hypothetical protein